MLTRPPRRGRSWRWPGCDCDSLDAAWRRSVVVVRFRLLGAASRAAVRRDGGDVFVAVAIVHRRAVAARYSIAASPEPSAADDARSSAVLARVRRRCRRRASCRLVRRTGAPRGRRGGLGHRGPGSRRGGNLASLGAARPAGAAPTAPTPPGTGRTCSGRSCRRASRSTRICAHDLGRPFSRTAGPTRARSRRAARRPRAAPRRGHSPTRTCCRTHR